MTVLCSTCHSLSAEAEGKTVEPEHDGRVQRTGKAAEADLMILIGKSTL